MKKIILLAVAVFSFKVQAAGEVLAQYSYGLDNFEVQVLEFDEEGVLSVGVKAANPLLGTDTQIIKTKKVNHEDLLYVSLLIQQLSVAEVVERYSPVICMMMPRPSQRYNHLYVVRDYDIVSNDFLSPLTLVQGPTGCFISNKVFLKHQADVEVAKTLKSVLKNLANEI